MILGRSAAMAQMAVRIKERKTAMNCFVVIGIAGSGDKEGLT
jgi:hypothetical protein